MTTRRKNAGVWRPLSGGAATVVFLLLILVASACSDSSPATGDTPGPAPSTADDSSTDTVSTSGESASIDDAALLSVAIAAVGTRYEFDLSVNLKGGTLTHIAGRVYDDSSAYLITAGDSELEYVITPQGRWIREPGEQWVVLREAAPVADPLSVLTDPTATEVLAEVGGTVTIAATYPGATLGFPDADQVTIEFVILDSRLASLRYQAAAGPDIATVETEISTALDIAPVTAPIPAG